MVLASHGTVLMALLERKPHTEGWRVVLLCAPLLAEAARGKVAEAVSRKPYLVVARQRTRLEQMGRS